VYSCVAERPGADAAFLLALIHQVIAGGTARPG
jgi:hypothetical protein